MTPEEFAVFYQEHHDRIEQWLSGRLRNWTIAQDLTARAFMQAWEHQSQCQGNFKAWAYQIAAHELHQHWRRSRPTVDLEDCYHLPDAEDLPRDFERQEEAKSARASLQNLTAGQKSALLLQIEGDSVSMIAAKLSAPAGTIGRRLFDAKKKLQEVLCPTANCN